MAENFNSNFYVTCATVIPVLFLAAAVQGQAFVFILQRAGRRTARQRALLTLRFLRFRAVAIVIAGVVGEPIALLVLYRESERPWQRPTVLATTLVLLVAVAAAPISAYADRVADALDVKAGRSAADRRRSSRSAAARRRGQWRSARRKLGRNSPPGRIDYPPLR